MKKWIPFLWFYPIVASFVSFFIVAEDFEAGNIVGAVIFLLCMIAQVALSLVYYAARKNFKPFVWIAGPVLFALTILGNIGVLSNGGYAILLLGAIPAVCSVMFMVTVRAFDRKKAKPAEPAAAAPAVAPAAPSASDPLEDIKKLKELLDMGAITQEEFETKKKQLLGL